MHCKRCGKAIGTDRGICPFCRAMLSKEQMAIYKQDKKVNLYKPKSLTNNCGYTTQVYEKRPNDTKYVWIIIGLVVILLVLIILLFLSMNS